MKIVEILRFKPTTVSTIAPERTLKNAADRLRVENIGALVITESGRPDSRVLGVLSEREIVRAFSRHGAGASSLFVKDAMVPAVTCTPHDDLHRIMAVMTRERVRHLPVIDGGRLVGVVSIGDALKARLQDLEMETNVLRDAYMAVH